MVDKQATAWGKEWCVGEEATPIEWPEREPEQLPQLTKQILCEAALTFPSNTGLGWDKCHPRAILR
eukprot:12235029-Karenia_brevis.AAC.1